MSCQRFARSANTTYMVAAPKPKSAPDNNTVPVGESCHRKYDSDPNHKVIATYIKNQNAYQTPQSAKIGNNPCNQNTLRPILPLKLNQTEPIAIDSDVNGRLFGRLRCPLSDYRKFKS